MNTQDTLKKKQKGLVKNSTLILLAFCTAFFSRVFSALHLPSAVNFLHFATVPLACGIAISTSRTKRLKQISNSKSILLGLLLLLTVTIASALLNHAGIINAILEFLLLAEPFIMLLAIVSIPMSSVKIGQVRTWILRFALANLCFAYLQKYAYHMENYDGNEDNIKGVFIGQGSGHVVGGSISLTFGVYYLVTAKNQPLWFRIVVFFATCNHVIISDTKQVFLAFLLALALLVLSNFKDIIKVLQLLLALSLVIGLLILAAYTVEPALLTWARPDILGEFIKLKFATFRIVPSYYHSFLNSLLGIGPGHTVGRLGGWMLDTYWNLLGPLGATRSPASTDVWKAVGASWLGDKSSMFSPLFGWAGIWGDLGCLGLATYFYLAGLVWNNFCQNDICRYLMFTLFVFGCIFSQLEEPGYTLFVATLIGIQWHEGQLIKSTRTHNLQIGETPLVLS